MNIYSKRRRARRLNDPNKTVEKDYPGDEVDADDLELDYGGVVEKADDEAEKRKRREEFAKSIGDSGDGLDFEEVWKGDREEDPEIDYSYDGITQSSEEKEREKDAAAIGEAVADELAARGLGGDDDGDTAPSAGDGGSVEKSGETTTDLLDDVQDDLRGMKRVESFKTLLKNYVEDGGNPEDPLPDVLEWYNEGNPEGTVRVENGSVTVENAAT